jgi:AraC-like DNA-binding protein
MMDRMVAISERSAISPVTAAGHAERVYSIAEGATPPSGVEDVSSSWQRSANKHGVDPADSTAPRILTTGELKPLREPLDELVFSAQEEIDQLYKVVREAGYTIMFCDVEERPVTVHRSQHFRSRHMNLSCSGAPVFGVDGRLMAVLDVSAIDPELSERAHALTGPLTIRSARAIEERFFRERFRREWIIAVAPLESGAPGMLLAVDGNQRIVGANRAARRSLLLDDRGLRAGVSLWTIFERDLDLFRRKDQADLGTRLSLAGSSDSRPALVTPPHHHIVRATSDPTSFRWHTRPRLDSIDTLPKLPPAPQAHGGLSAGTMRRVREYVEAHLGDSINLGMLAAVAGLSVHHFAREFKQSAGVTPHHYLTRKRVERAQEMLALTDLSLSEVAYATGFSDQGHLARHFRHMLGTTPGAFRWSQR